MNRLGWEQRHGRAAAPMQRMGGRGGDEFFVPVISKTDYSFDGRLSGTTQSVTLAAGIDTVSWVSGVLAVRLHAKNTWTATVTMTVVVENVSLVPEDPSVLFVSTGAALATASFTNASVAPSLVTQSATGFAGMVQVRLTWAQGGTAAAGAQTVSLSLDLIGRPA